jgi:type II secretory pathway component GspD/PulD (secretin)
MRPRLTVPLLLLATLAGPAAAARMVTEVIPVGYRNADEVVEILRPLVPPPGSISALYNQLIVKTTPENLRELKWVLQSIDRPPANLLVSVKHLIDEEVQRDLAQAFGEVRSGDVTVSTGRTAKRRRGLTIEYDDGESSGGVNVVQRRRRSDSENVQTVRVLEGKEAFIATGTAAPFPEQTTIVRDGRVIVQNTVTYTEASNGFYVRPRLAGDRVTLEIFPSANRFRGANIEIREVSTTVSARLGQWMEIAGVSGSGTQSRSEIGRASARQSTSSYVVYVKVTRLP